jgi:hypothetical protein
MIEEDRDLLFFSTAGASMFPFIRWDEQILVKRVLPEKLNIGDIILFQSEKGDKICHRLAKIESRDGLLWFQTKGERSKFYDPVVSQQAILGKVIAIKRRRHLRGFPLKRWRFFSEKFDGFFAGSVFFIKKLLKRVIFLLKRTGPS